MVISGTTSSLPWRIRRNTFFCVILNIGAISAASGCQRRGTLTMIALNAVYTSTVDICVNKTTAKRRISRRTLGCSRKKFPLKILRTTASVPTHGQDTQSTVNGRGYHNNTARHDAMP
ncbi:hypothetical protein PF002_g26597 [Phytophthora fragariae]|uniref:Uncharacterized protein n=1 Tax=Phytophthora fragariae TaxID=53985 RepID=A0A6A3WEU3_9STRA|nr:hypothetical protein PF003_g14200 [Phytophthora fragariae]KAE9178474.1 hypothetical protein PF004_g25470 [Phytophthora fragariae]KAE9183837.1 hypothetical protein PF002_g26597 [Phytophthora fragariae]